MANVIDWLYVGCMAGSNSWALLGQSMSWKRYPLHLGTAVYAEYLRHEEGGDMRAVMSLVALTSTQLLY